VHGRLALLIVHYEHRCRSIASDTIWRVDALDLILLGRHLSKIGERALRGDPPSQTTTGRALVLRDVFANPHGSVSEITHRTGLPQSYVSESIAALRDDGILETSSDPTDRRRTRVTVSPAHRRRVATRASTPIDAALGEEVGQEQVRMVLPVLQRLAEVLVADHAGPIIATIRADQSRPDELD
jgi:DNA-binding MarR family transcriptional regulator